MKSCATASRQVDRSRANTASEWKKWSSIGEQFSDDSLEMIRQFKNLFDPQCCLNPGKVLPTGKGCMEIRQPAGMMLS